MNNTIILNAVLRRCKQRPQNYGRLLPKWVLKKLVIGSEGISESSPALIGISEDLDQLQSRARGRSEVDIVNAEYGPPLGEIGGGIIDRINAIENRRVG